MSDFRANDKQLAPISKPRSNSLHAHFMLAEQQMTPIEFMSDDGKVKQLKMEERDFRSVVGLLRVAEAQEPGQGQ